MSGPRPTVVAAVSASMGDCDKMAHAGTHPSDSSVYLRTVLARSVTHALVGLEPRRVEVEAHIQGGVEVFALVGRAIAPAQEAKHRVKSGVLAAALEWPKKRLTVNLAPAPRCARRAPATTSRSRWRSWPRRGSSRRSG